MNAEQKLHQSNLAKWTALFHEQASSGLTVKNWCVQNNISIHKYNHWKRMVKEMYVDSVLPDIVPISPVSLPSLPSAPPDSQLAGLRDSRDSCNSSEARKLSPKQFEWFMDGFSIDPQIMIAHPDRSA